MIARLVLAVVVGVVVILICILVGGLLMATNISLAVAVGAFLKAYATVLGLLAALWYFFAGGLNWPVK
jgi:hypothetical protein